MCANVPFHMRKQPLAVVNQAQYAIQMIFVHSISLIKPQKVFIPTFGRQMNGVELGKIADGLNAALGGELHPQAHAVTACDSLRAMAQP